MKNTKSKNLFFSLVLGFATFACSHSPKSAPVREESKREIAAQIAVEKTEEDERMAPKIQKDLNAIFFKQREEDPSGLDAFSANRIQELELALGQSELPSIRYYRENRNAFDRFEDSGGGFRIVANAVRLVPHRKTAAGHRKLFAMDTARVKEMITNPCFSAVEDCGEYASDGEENTPLLEEWTKKYADPEFKKEREKVLRGYLAVLEKYQKRTAHLKTPKKFGKKQAELMVGSHIRGVQLLLKD